MNALDEAVKAAGSQAALARLIGVSGQSTIGNWVLRGGVVPSEYCARIEAATGVPRKRLRPHDYWLIWPDLPAPNSPESGGIKPTECDQVNSVESHQIKSAPTTQEMNHV